MNAPSGGDPPRIVHPVGPLLLINHHGYFHSST